MKKDIYAVPTVGTVNVHPSLLPKYRGPNPYIQTILHGEKETGVTIHRVNVEYDSGEIVAQTTVPVLPNDTPENLGARVLEKEHEFIVEVIADIVNGKIAIG